MTEPVTATAATLRWYKRSVERRFDEDIDQWAEEHPDDRGLTLQFGVRMRGGKADNAEPSDPVIRVRVVLALEEAKVSAVVDGGVEFAFAKLEHGVLTRSQAIEFIKDQGLPYVIGLERGVIADMTRQVGLPATLVPPRLPPGLLNDIEEALIDVDDDQAEVTPV